jgi:bifunctional UDP-N-acetylglucosamine pyrophosphorylase/glucosamine-1-phosphate N-acetyltransferase
MVVCGDTPLLTSETLQRLCTVHDAEAAAATVLTSTPDNPLGYGRVVRGGDGGVAAIVEEADADARTRAVREVNSGIYVFDGGLLREALSKLSRDNSQGEEYLTDVVGILVRDGHRVAAATVDDANEVIGVNDRVQLANARKQMQNRINEHWMREGVSIIDPSTTMIGAGVTIEPEATIHPWTLLEGSTSVASGAAVGPGTQVIDTTVGPGAVIRFSVVDRSDIGANAQVGPFTHLRPDTRLGEDARAGAFVETKNAQVGRGSKVPHLSYVGDADIGEGSNIGAATVFVNYDGVAKHHTHIGDHVRIGSDTMLVAPVSVGDGAYTAAGSVITDDVPPGAMGVGRARQRTILGWVLRKRAGTSSARAAEAAGDTPSTAGDNGAQGPKEGSSA